MRNIPLVLALLVGIGRNLAASLDILDNAPQHVVDAEPTENEIAEGTLRPLSALALSLLAAKSETSAAFALRSHIGAGSSVSERTDRIGQLVPSMNAAGSLTPVPLSPWVALQAIFNTKSFSEFMSFVRDHHGDAVSFHLWPVLPPTYLLMGKAANRRVLQSLDTSLEQIAQELINFLPIDSRVPSEVDYDLQKMVRSLFSNTAYVNKRLPSFKANADRMRKRWLEQSADGSDKDSLNVFFELSEYVLRADLEVLFGTRFTERHAPELIERFANWVRNIANGQLVGFFDYLGELLREEVADMQANPEDYLAEKSLLQVYIKSGVLDRVDEDGIVGLLSMTLMAAVFNTQVSLAWLLVHLYADPELLARARKEIAACPDLQDYEALSKLDFLNSCIDESVRLHTMLPGNIVLRKALRDVQLGDKTVEQGSVFWLYPNAVHQDEGYFPDSRKFCPMRLLKGEKKRMESEFELVTFGHGKKRCLGERMARAQLLAFLAQILPAVEADAPEDLPAEGFFDLIPASELRLNGFRNREPELERTSQASS